MDLIGIRKVLGASPIGIMLGLIRDFSRWVIIAMLLVLPFGPFLVKKILSVYAYQTDIGLPMYVMAGLLALIVAWLAVSIQSLKAAMTNPVTTLRQQ